MSGDSTTGLYTPEMRAAVEKIPDDKIRQSLLHATMLLERMEGDRDRALNESVRLEGVNLKLREGLRDFAERGLRCDLNPTHLLSASKDEIELFWAKYLAEQDERVRQRANFILNNN